jgi:hypothetical protein
MKHFKLFGLALVALFVLGVTATSAFALPDISLTLSGSTFPLVLKANQTKAATQLSNVVGEKVNGEGVLIVLSLTALGHLGTFEALFTKAKKGTSACHSEESGVSDPAEEILTKGSWHLVYTSLPSTPALALGILFLVAPVTFKCGTETVNVKGDTLSSVTASSAGTETTELTSLGGVLEGNGVGVQNLKTFYNESGTATTAKLEANFGSGFKGAAEEVKEEVKPTAEGSNMFVITSR